MKIKTERIERVSIKYDPKESLKVWSFIESGNYHLIRSGPKPLGYGTYSRDKYECICERSVEA